MPGMAYFSSKKRPTLPLSTRISDMDGRKVGSRCQHIVHMPHHASVSRLLVASAAGRYGSGPTAILVITPYFEEMSWKGICRVKSSYEILQLD